MTDFCLNCKNDIDFISEAFNILSEPNRIKIFCLLSKNEKLCVCEIIEKLNLKQNLVSHHLSIFKRIGLLESERKGTKIFYKINQKNYAKLKNIIGEIFNF